MSGVYIPNVAIPKEHNIYITLRPDGSVHVWDSYAVDGFGAQAIPVLDHGRLIDADELRGKMYHEAFETDSPLQKWDSGCWIRYKMFEQMEKAAPTIIPGD